MKTILNNWSAMRVVRFLLGGIALVVSIFQKDVALGILAGFLLTTSIANVGCCGSTGCAVDLKAKNKSKYITESPDV